jgi:hypothetical protein
VAEVLTGVLKQAVAWLLALVMGFYGAIIMAAWRQAYFSAPVTYWKLQTSPSRSSAVKN